MSQRQERDADVLRIRNDRRLCEAQTLVTENIFHIGPLKGLQTAHHLHLEAFEDGCGVGDHILVGQQRPLGVS